MGEQNCYMYALIWGASETWVVIKFSKFTHKQVPGEKFGEKNARCALIGGDSRDPSDTRQFLADCAIWR